MTFLTLCCAFSIFYFGAAVRNFEKTISPRDGANIFKFNYYWNAFWCMILTMTTVGYGDIFPVTTAGRITTIIACIWGMFVVSMIIVTLTNIIMLTKEEDAAYKLIV
jgi:voltage-gated potassium channel Kch